MVESKITTVRILPEDWNYIRKKNIDLRGEIHRLIEQRRLAEPEERKKRITELKNELQQLENKNVLRPYYDDIEKSLDPDVLEIVNQYLKNRCIEKPTRQDLYWISQRIKDKQGPDGFLLTKDSFLQVCCEVVKKRNKKKVSNGSEL